MCLGAPAAPVQGSSDTEHSLHGGQFCRVDMLLQRAQGCPVLVKDTMMAAERQKPAAYFGMRLQGPK